MDRLSTLDAMSPSWRLCLAGYRHPATTVLKEANRNIHRDGPGWFYLLAIRDWILVEVFARQMYMYLGVSVVFCYGYALLLLVFLFEWRPFAYGCLLTCYAGSLGKIRCSPLIQFPESSTRRKRPTPRPQ